mmetsp:Transcript_16670/g.33602  ORF Transcript_16670/g.33602 Transcript_16670/m.33602 type:complete len:334 (-) Transcript_16670:631-1632(-)
MLGLPAWCTFVPLDPAPVAVPIQEGSFASHTFYRLPCDFMCEFSRGRKPQGKFDLVHQLVVNPARASALNEYLGALAILMERQTHEPDGDAGTKITNWGGYQSHPVLFGLEPEPDDGDSTADTRELHTLVSAAMEEVATVCTSHEQYPDETRPAPGELHPAYAWLNVNRATNLNFLHIHDPTKWSAVYFVASGAAPAEDRSADGHLLFRCGTPRRSGHGGSGRVRTGDGPGGAGVGGGDSDVEPTASHSYLAVPPTPGSLWLFPGSIPHAVLGVHGTAAEPNAGEVATTSEPKPARISVAINLIHATPPAASPTLGRGRRSAGCAKPSLSQPV